MGAGGTVGTGSTVGGTVGSTGVVGVGVVVGGVVGLVEGDVDGLALVVPPV